MNDTLHESLRVLINEVGSNQLADIYHTVWGERRALDVLPVISRDELFGSPLASRRYKSASSLVKIFHVGEKTFLSEWAYEDVAREQFGTETKRPMVYLSDNAESIEKSMWCYERGMVPLIGEVHNPAAAVAMAKKYQIDSLITDELSLERFRPFFGDCPYTLTSISIIGPQFTIARIQWVLPYAKEVRLVLTLPETGAFARAKLEVNPVFSPLPRCDIETVGETLVLTKQDSLVTPIIRYDTAISSKSVRIQNA